MQSTAGYDENVVTQELVEANCKAHYINMEKFKHLSNYTLKTVEDC